jgi:hypothetical protein
VYLTVCILHYPRSWRGRADLRITGEASGRVLSHFRTERCCRGVGEGSGRVHGDGTTGSRRPTERRFLVIPCRAPGQLRHLRMDRHGSKKGRMNISVQIKQGRTEEERKLGDYLN